MLEAHLGGHQNKTHLDHGALDWLIKTTNAKTKTKNKTQKNRKHKSKYIKLKKYY